jgi:diguanylate cyclase (GGDEF)-like protein
VPAIHATRLDELKATNQLPSPAGVALAILRLAESELATRQEIARALQTDPALPGRVLKLANSVAAGRARAVTSVREAVTHLGVRLVRNVALGFSLVSQTGQGACRAFDYAGFWSRSLAMGVAAQGAAAYTARIAPAEAFTCGLLAQVGRLALASVYPEAYGPVLARGGDPADLVRLEREAFATDHNELTSAMLRDWGLPEVCVEAARLRARARVFRLQEEVRRDKEELRRCMAELGVANRKLQQAALTDALTGLYNRRYALDRLDQEWAAATRSGAPLACLLVDIDYFKRVNDTHGHDVGDRVLRETARVLREGLRHSDVVCRLGGEEFVVFGPGMDLNAACGCAERLHANVEARQIEVPNGTTRVTLSIGVALRTADTAGPAGLLKAADEAVYAATQGGRNQVRLAPLVHPGEFALASPPRPCVECARG